MGYESFSIGNEQMLVSYDDGRMEIIPKETLNDISNRSEEFEFKSNKVYFSEILTRMIKEYAESIEDESSKAGERVYVSIVKENVKWSNDGLDYFGEYKIIGCNSQEVKSTQMIEVVGMIPAWKNVSTIYRSLLQIWFSGYHATPEDVHIFRAAMERRH